ncbi:hypothetical protein Tco_0920183 [Tanacetum coccineum]
MSSILNRLIGGKYWIVFGCHEEPPTPCCEPYGLPSLGVKLLGGADSRDADFISGLTIRRAANIVDLMGLIPQTCQSVHMEEAALFFNKGLRGLIENMVVCGGPFFGSQSWVLQDHILPDSGICGMDDDYVSAVNCLRDTIPRFDFSCFTNKDTAPSKAQQTLASALFSEMVKDMEVHFDMTVRQKAVFECLLDEICPVCRKACLDSFGEHTRVGISSNIKALVNFLTDQLDGRSTLRPVDVLIFGWVGGKHACVDLIRVSPLVGFE